jgi:MOSC domain-containing protein YiiM
LSREALVVALGELPPAPTDHGTVDLLLARPSEGARALPKEVMLTVEGGMPGDRWALQDKYGPNYQLATTRTDFAKVVSAGQPLELHGDNLFVTLDLSVDNLPPGSRVKMGEARLEVTPQAHNGCKKWVQRVGLAAMKLNMEPEQQRVHLRGIYFRVVESGRVRLGDAISVLSRGS